MKKLLFWLALVVFAATASAQVQQARGKATVSYQGAAASPADKDRAALAAQMKAVEFYYAEAGQSESENFDAIRDKIAANPDRYILDTTVLSEQDDAAKKQYTVSMRVSLNLANLRNAVKTNSAVGRAAAGDRRPLAFMFVSRQVDSVKSFDDRVTKRVDESDKVRASGATSEKGREGESIQRGQVATNASTSKAANSSFERSRTVETGGTSTRRAAESTWRLIPSSNLAQVFSNTFAKSGYRVSEAALIEPYAGGRFRVADVENDYKSGNDLKAATLNSLVVGMRTAQISYVALGTLDVGMADKDPQTGLVRVSVTVNAKMLDVSQTIPDTLASVGPVQYAGLGPTEDEARTNALKLAANNAARELSAQVTNANVR